MTQSNNAGRRLLDATRRLGRHETSSMFAGAALGGLAVGLVVIAALLLLDRFVPLDRTSSRALAIAAGLAFLAALAAPVAVLARAAWARRKALVDLEESARRTELQAESLHDRLVPALQVLRARDETRTGYSVELIDATVEVTARDAEAVRPRALPYWADLTRVTKRFAGAAAVFVAVAVALGPAGTRNGFANLAGTAGRLGPQPGPEFVVRPGDGSVPRGGAIRLEADVRHAIVSAGSAAAVLQWRSREDEPWRDVALQGEAGAEPATARFAHELADVRESFRYRFRHGSAISREHAVEAVAAPGLAIEEVRYEYPQYTGLAERVVQDGGGDLAALRGTVAHVVVRSTNEPQSGAARLGSGAELALVVGPERRLTGSIPLAADDTYTLRVRDVLGLENANPPEYRIRALPDEPPFLRLVEPGEDRNLDESMTERLRFSALDDFGLGPVELVWEVSRRPGRAQRTVVHRPEGVRTEIDATWQWDLGGLDLLPGDAVVYHLEVRDNNPVEGPSAARTRDYVLRFPTLGEVFAEIDEGQETSIDDLAEAVEEARRIEAKVEDVSREILKQGESSWENRQEVERALQAQEQLAEKLRTTREQVESNLQDLAQSELATLDAVEKLQKIQELLDEVTSREMKEALEKLREAMKETNPDEAQQDLAEFDKSQEELMKQLDRILRNLEQFRLEEALKAAVRRMEEMAADQERVNDQLAQRNPKEDPREAKDDAEAKPADETKQDESKDGDSGKAEEPTGDDEAASKPEESKSDESKAGESKSEESKSEKPESGSEKKSADMERMAREEQALAEEMRKLEKEIKELAQKTEQLRESQDAQSMKDLASRMDDAQVPQSMDEMADQLQQGAPQEAQEEGEKALTELRDMLAMLNQAQQGMATKMAQVSQAAINRAVRDLLSLSEDQESLGADLDDIPRNSSSATRAFADEQHLLLRGAERVRDMLEEVAKDTPLMDSKVGRSLGEGISSMQEAADGLESGAVHLANDEGDAAVEELNAVVIELLQTAQAMSSCASGMPMSSFMQQLKELSGDQQKLNDAIKRMREQGGSSLDKRLQAQMKNLAQEQQRIQEELQKLVQEMGSGQGLLGRLDDVSKKLDEVAKKLGEGKVDEATLREQEWALTRLLDSQRSMRERDLGRERISETGDDLADGVPPSALPEGMERTERDLREDLLKALERRYPPKYEDLIRRYFRELSREAPVPDLP